MLYLPTLWFAMLGNFVALTLVWVFVLRSYPSIAAARYWAAAAGIGALACAVGLLRTTEPVSLALVFGGSSLILACCLAEQGIRRFYDLPLSWRTTLGIPAVCGAGMAFFFFAYDSMPVRIIIYSFGQIVPVALGLRVLLTERHDGRQPGAQLAACVAIGMIAVNVARCIGVLTHAGGELTIVDFNGFQVVLILLLAFLALAWNFGFLLLAIDRLRTEVADLALVDDLTGVANRRHFLQRLQQECLRAQRSRKPFALLAIDLDRFKEVNDNFGHAAGDHSLRHFTLMVQSRLRPGDLLARVGGDEFCVVLPNTQMAEAAPIARRILDACRIDALGCTGDEIPLAASIGVAQWTEKVGPHAERLLEAADIALYSAKNAGRNRYATADAPAGPRNPAMTGDAPSFGGA